MSDERPRLDVDLPEVTEDDSDAQQIAINQQIEAFADTLDPDTWFEVWYPATTAETYDVVRVGAEGIVTLEVFEDVSNYAENFKAEEVTV